MIYIFARSVAEAKSCAARHNISREDYRPITNDRSARHQIFERGDKILVHYQPRYSEFLAYRGITWIKAKGLVVNYADDAMD